jgi:hypothetical protein
VEACGVSSAEDLADLVAQLVDEVHTVEHVARYKTVKRGGGRSQVKVEHPEHHTRAPGLLHQLHAIQSAAKSVPVKIYRWEPDRDDTCKGRCAHGRWVHIRTEQSSVMGVVRSGGAVPGGSPSWDTDGSLSALAGGTFESRSPATSATDLLGDIIAGTDRLRAKLSAAAGRPTGAARTTSAQLRQLVGLALEVDDDLAARTVGQVRSWVSAARVCLGYDGPVVALRDMGCPECGGELRVRADASTAVWCAGRPATKVQGPARWIAVQGPAREGEDWPVGYAEDWPVVYPAYDGCGQTYPQGSWIKLLEQAG